MTNMTEFVRVRQFDSEGGGEGGVAKTYIERGGRRRGNNSMFHVCLMLVCVIF